MGEMDMVDMVEGMAGGMVVEGQVEVGLEGQ